jgi:AAA+ ATPase superfamily predicted ATPase
VLYGRRRVGKTELLRAFCEGKAHIFFVATLCSDPDQLATFSQLIWRFTHSEVPDGFTFPGWEAAFRALTDLPGRPVVVLDEFTYLISGNKAIPSILQKVWDEVLKNTGIFLILCGSYIRMIETEVLGYQAALYGRRTGRHLLSPFEMPEAALFFPNYNPTQQLEAWSVLGGMPYYLCAFSDTEDIFANIRDQILDEQGLLYNEPHLLLMEELREPRNYFSILRAIAQGRKRLNEIVQSAGVGSATTTIRYLDILQQMRIVERRVPATESQPEKSKKGLYHITDPFLRFWFRYVQPYRGSLVIGMVGAILNQRIIPTFDQYVGLSFEEAAREYVARLARRGDLPFLPESIGGWWDRENEIDLIAASYSERSLLLGECKWSEKPVGTNILDSLKKKSQDLSVTGDWRSLYYVLFSKSGFTPTLEKIAKDEGVRLVKPGEMVQREKL